MNEGFNKQEIIRKYPFIEEEIKKENIEWNNLEKIYYDFNNYKELYKVQADFIANTLRSHKKIHSVKSRIKNSEGLVEKIVRKTRDRKGKYGDDFYFNIENYKVEITDLIGIRAIHIFKQDWEDIHEFILNTWKVIEITANVRDGDDTKRFEELDIAIKSRKSGYRSVHYLVELNFIQSEPTIAEIQVRTIFEEGYGEIDHQLSYSNTKIPDILKSNLLLFNRLVGSADEMASLINMLNKNLMELDNGYKCIVEEKEEYIKSLEEKIKRLEENIDHKSKN